MSSQSSDSFKTLDELPPGRMALVRHVGSDLLDLERLKVMGLCEGQTVKVTRAGERMIVCCCGTRIGMSRHLARQIAVAPLSEEPAADGACSASCAAAETRS